MSTPRGRDALFILALAGVILAGTALRLWLAWWLGHLGDLELFRLWALDPDEPHHAAASSLQFPRNYPPLYMVILRLMRWAHRWLELPGDFTQSILIADDPEAIRPILLYLKLPAITADALCTVLIYRLGLLFARPAASLACAAFYAFNPAILYDGAYYGQTDTIQFAFALATVAALLRRCPFRLGLAGMAAILLKAQAIVTLIVVVAVIAIEWDRIWRTRWLRIAGGAACPLAATLMLAALTGQLPQFVHGYIGITSSHPRVTNNALNIWWLAYRPWDRAPYIHTFPDDTTHVIPGISRRTVGLVLFAAGMALIVWRLHRARCTPHAIVLAAAAAGWAFFLLPTQMHERYSVPAVGFMCLLGLWQRRWYVWTAIASIAVALNIALAQYFLFPPARWLQRAVNWIIWPEREREWTILCVVLILMLPVCLEALWRVAKKRSDELRSGFPVLPGDAAGHRVSGPPS